MFYQRLSKPLVTLDEALVREENTPISLALHQLLKSNYQMYQKQMARMNKTQDEHLVFMDMWVHQMKTPLSVIELMAQDLDEPHSSSIREETDKLKTGLQTVLYMSRLRSIVQDFHVKQMNLKDIVQSVNKENRRFFIRNQVYPTLYMEDEGMIVESDEKWLSFMITQLIHNAVKYSTGKSDHIVISIYLREGQPLLEITDYGVGIPKSDLKRIYDAFFTGENGRQFKESTGVGLYVTKEVANHLGHGIEVESIQSERTTFRIVFAK
jgi:signal transduction histidine kinase